MRQMAYRAMLDWEMFCQTYPRSGLSDAHSLRPALRQHQHRTSERPHPARFQINTEKFTQYNEEFSYTKNLAFLQGRQLKDCSEAKPTQSGK